MILQYTFALQYFAKLCFVPLHCCIVFHCVIISFVHSTADGHLGCFQLFATINIAAVHSLANVSLGLRARLSLRIIPRGGMDEFTGFEHLQLP